MKKLFILAVVAVVALPALAQEPEYYFAPDKHLPEFEFKLPDSLAYMTPWKAELRRTERLEAPNPSISMTSVIVLPKPKPVTRFNFAASAKENAVVMQHITLTGQSWNWSPYPDAYLDARALSMPGRR